MGPQGPCVLATLTCLSQKDLVPFRVGLYHAALVKSRVDVFSNPTTDLKRNTRNHTQIRPKPQKQSG